MNFFAPSLKHSEKSNSYKKLAYFIHLALLGSSFHAFAEQPETSEEDNIENIVIYGEKLGGSLAENTSSVTVFSDKADNGENRTYYDLLDQVPNVLNAPSGVPHIRGVDGRGPGEGFLSFMTGATPRVNTTVDGVSESWTGEAFGKAGLWDTEQVEIYKGPQSTNQGRNSIGGAVVIKTKDPTFDHEAKVRAGFENKDNKYHLAGVVSAPIVDNELAFRIAAETTKGNSPIEYSLPEGDQYPWDPSDFESYNVRGKLLWKPSGNDNLTAKLTLASRNEEGQYTNLISTLGTLKYDEPNGTRIQDTKSWNANLDVNYVIDNTMTLDVLISQRDYDTKFEAYPIVEWSGDVDESNTMVEAKLSYDSLDNTFEAIVGLSHFNKKQDTETDSMTRDDDIRTNAVFFDSKTRLNDQWGLLLGARYEKDTLERDFDHFRFPIDFTSKEDNDIFLPKIGLTYASSDNENFGFTVRKGYNAGGVGYNEYKQETFIFEQEEVWTYELSSRLSYLDNRLNITANIFYNDYENYQAVVFGDSGHRFDNYIDNIPEGKTIGTEIEAKYWLDSGLDLFAFLGLLDTEIEESPKHTVGDISGNDFSYTPKVSAGLGFTQYLDSGFSFGARINYVSDYYVDLANTEETQAGNYTVINLNVGYQADDFNVHAYVKNAANREYVVRHKNDLIEVGGPITVGVMVDYSF